MNKVTEAFRKAVEAQVVKGGRRTWGADDSCAVIESLVDCLINEKEVASEGYDAIADRVKKVVNPSAFAQVLESLPDGTGMDAEGKASRLTFDAASYTVREAGKDEVIVPHPMAIRRPTKGKRSTGGL